MSAVQVQDTPAKETITCHWCSCEFHHLKSHLQGKCTGIPDEHKSSTVEDIIAAYTTQFTDAPTISPLAIKTIQARKQEIQAAECKAQTVKVGYIGTEEYKVEMVAAHELLGVDLKNLSTALNQPLKVSVNVNTPFPEFVPVAKDNYVYGDFELIKDVLMMMELGIPGYLWGHAGTGKTSLPTQLCALMNRPVIRSQHTASTEEAHISGQILARDGSTYFEPGLLALAMRHGWVYLADEYDFAFPQILGIYQPVLEGEGLVIKEATPEWRRVAPHKRFAFIATGNTNGSGDETGLYQGTNLQNAANFSRFGIVSKVHYMSQRAETNMLVKAGATDDFAQKLVRFATLIREGYETSVISQPIGPRELLLSLQVGIRRGDIPAGLQRAFINKLPSASAQAAREIADRIFV
ncbi:AAA family ATPase [Cronobacter sakazakii]